MTFEEAELFRQEGRAAFLQGRDESSNPYKCGRTAWDPVRERHHAWNQGFREAQEENDKQGAAGPLAVPLLTPPNVFTGSPSEEDLKNYEVAMARLRDRIQEFMHHERSTMNKDQEAVSNDGRIAHFEHQVSADNPYPEGAGAATEEHRLDWKAGFQEAEESADAQEKARIENKKQVTFFPEGAFFRKAVKTPGGVKAEGRYRLATVEDADHPGLVSVQDPLTGAFTHLVPMDALTETSTPCCERDHDKDGNCDRHPAPKLELRAEISSSLARRRDSLKGTGLSPNEVQNVPLEELEEHAPALRQVSPVIKIVAAEFRRRLAGAKKREQEPHHAALIRLYHTVAKAVEAGQDVPAEIKKAAEDAYAVMWWYHDQSDGTEE